MKKECKKVIVRFPITGLEKTDPIVETRNKYSLDDNKLGGREFYFEAEGLEVEITD